VYRSPRRWTRRKTHLGRQRRGTGRHDLQLVVKVRAEALHHGCLRRGGRLLGRRCSCHDLSLQIMAKRAHEHGHTDDARGAQELKHHKDTR
jgi:hypothetical protein